MPPEMTKGKLEILGIHRRELLLKWMQKGKSGSQIEPESQPASSILPEHRSASSDNQEP
jgi:hypothetical protein